MMMRPDATEFKPQPGPWMHGAIPYSMVGMDDGSFIYNHWPMQQEMMTHMAMQGAAAQPHDVQEMMIHMAMQGATAQPYLQPGGGDPTLGSRGSRRRRQRHAQASADVEATQAYGYGRIAATAVDGGDGESGDDTAAEPDEDALVEEIANDLKAKLDGGGAERVAMLASVPKIAQESKAKSRALQHLLDVVPMKDRLELVNSLKNHIRDCYASPFANYVLQKVVEIMTPEQGEFIIEEVADIAGKVARHRYGCRVLCHVVQYCSMESRHAQLLIDAIMQDGPALCRHTFGNYVIQQILEHGETEHRHQVADALLKDDRNAKNRNASHVLEKALEQCPREDICALAESLLESDKKILELATHQFGCFIVRALLKTPSEFADRTREYLFPYTAELEKSRNGKKVLEALKVVQTSDSA
eukprot:NODE_7258_length_1595_cov_6.322207.p1 GENE.NODE_7258_length_1595_cov_6.322207~~NODE_7258_length_1595_cov_6.322207.p1  ORF type:complete len:457 (+),score=116.85 NODE_7258_length_1595_cov_6.322207:129-1373(+)